ncbi:MFS transporter [Lederbergia graminis]|uniref:MFS transporter n=1 Tax=Lederbergia graminis TaxID=735518 RepID=A0ABW0LE49_9BACI|nr:MFS transporter [Paenibacillus bovis]HLU22418.1 MFS transporter [Bacillaceae bacterium]
MTGDQRKKLLILMINMFIAIGSFGIIIPILPQYLESINQGGTAAGLMIAIFAGAQLVMSPIAGKWTDQYGRRKMIILGLAGLTLSSFIFYATDSIWVLYLSRVVGGVGSALLVPAIFAYVADITTFEQRAKGNSFISAAMSLGIVIGPGIGGFLAKTSLKTPLLVSAIISLVAVLFSVIVLKESKPETSSSVQNGAAVDSESMIAKMIRSVKMPYFVPLLITLIMSFGLMSYESVLGLFVDNEFGATPQEIAFMITATGIVSVIVQLFIVDRIVNRFGEVTILNIFIAVVTVGFILALLAKSYTLFFGITLLIFLATSILRPVLNTLISKMAGEEQGFAMGMNNAYMSVGNILGPTLAGMLYDVKITYPFIMGLLILAIAMVTTFMWQKRLTKQKQQLILSK